MFFLSFSKVSKALTLSYHFVQTPDKLQTFATVATYAQMPL